MLIDASCGEADSRNGTAEVGHLKRHSILPTYREFNRKRNCHATWLVYRYQEAVSPVERKMEKQKKGDCSYIIADSEECCVDMTASVIRKKPICGRCKRLIIACIGNGVRRFQFKSEAFQTIQGRAQPSSKSRLQPDIE
jgi:hypothetical protein